MLCHQWPALVSCVNWLMHITTFVPRCSLPLQVQDSQLAPLTARPGTCLAKPHCLDCSHRHAYCTAFLLTPLIPSWQTSSALLALTGTGNVAHPPRARASLCSFPPSMPTFPHRYRHCHSHPPVRELAHARPTSIAPLALALRVVGLGIGLDLHQVLSQAVCAGIVVVADLPVDLVQVHLIFSLHKLIVVGDGGLAYRPL